MSRSRRRTVARRTVVVSVLWIGTSVVVGVLWGAAKAWERRYEPIWQCTNSLCGRRFQNASSVCPFCGVEPVQHDRLTVIGEMTRRQARWQAR